MQNELDVEGFFRALKAVFGVLSPKERRVLFMRRGINPELTSHTLEEVGKEMGVTRERIRQIEAKAQEQIRTIIKDISVLPLKETI